MVFHARVGIGAYMHYIGRRLKWFRAFWQPIALAFSLLKVLELRFDIHVMEQSGDCRHTIDFAFVWLVWVMCEDS